jgi:plastocyanin
MQATDDKRRDLGLTQLAAVVAVLLSMASLLAVAFKLDDSGGQQLATAASGMPMHGAMHGGYGASGGVAGEAEESVKLTIKSDEERGRKGPDGNWHDAFLPADFSVSAGATVRVTVYNYDDMPHSFNADQLGTDVTIPGGSEDKPSVTTFTFRAPQTAGSYEWYCAMPCDPWAMNHDGYMRGRVTVT